MVVGPPAIRADDPLEVGADQLFEAVAVAVGGDPEDRRLRRGRRPQRALLAPGAPAGLIDIERRGAEHGVEQPLVRALEHGRGALTDRIDLILRRKFAARAAMPGLPARAAQQLLRLRPRLRAPLLTRLRRIRGRRLGAVARARPCLLLQPAHPLLQPLAAPGQLLAAP